MQNMPSHLLNLLAVVAVVESMVAAFFERRALAAAVVAVAAWQVSLDSSVKLLKNMLNAPHIHALITKLGTDPTIFWG